MRPLVRVVPAYPRAALRRKTQGWVIVEFAISKTGTDLEPKILQALQGSVRPDPLIASTGCS